MIERQAVQETRMALFRAAVVTDCLGETDLGVRRIGIALLHTESLRRVFARIGVQQATVIAAIDATDPSFDECEQRVAQELAASGHAFASKEHQASVRLRPLAPDVKGVFDRLIERDGALEVSPVDLLVDLLDHHAVLAEMFAVHGLTASALRAADDQR
ncbi:MAG TPA: hypothetical protein VE010_24495 [Thermoanaerobaculia bacterium]|nr:hypothetical protein [Thermoanaerobaculia bacterium]